jgi:xanthine dehydrogenase accessory factor
MTEGSAAQIAEEVARALEGGDPVLVATLIAAPEANAERVGSKLLVRTDGSHAGTLGFFPLNAAVKEGAAEAFRRHRTHTRYLSPKGEELTRQDAGPDSFQVMVEVHEQPCSLVIAGGGHVGKALSEIGALCGFRVTVVDDRPEYANEERFPEADRVIRGRFEEVLTDYPLDATTYVVAVTRGHRHDEVSLRAVVGRGSGVRGDDRLEAAGEGGARAPAGDGSGGGGAGGGADADRAGHWGGIAGGDRGEHHGGDCDGEAEEGDGCADERTSLVESGRWKGVRRSGVCFVKMGVFW